MSAEGKIIDSAREVQALADQLKQESKVAIDTEFIRESTFYPIVELLQVATTDQTWLIDAQVFRKDKEALKPLLDILEDPKILKILHAAQGDQECLYTAFGVVAKPSFDTSVAASLCGYGDSIGLGRLLKIVLNVTLVKGHARTNWAARPLPKQLQEYARADVEHLVKLADSLIEQLEKEGRKDWALELSSKWEDTGLYEPDIDGLTQKLARSGRFDSKGFAVLRALVQWREDRVRELNLPRRWVADDHVLVDLARVKPKDVAHLSTFRGLNKGELRSSGEALVQIIKEAQKIEVIPPPKTQRSSVPSDDEVHVLELLRCYVSLLADRHRIAAKHLLTSTKLLSLLRAKTYDLDHLEKTGVLGGEALKLVGQELVQLLQGEKALVVREGRVQVLDLPKVTEDVPAEE